ncbi:MAG: TPM domain-containing protein [Oscillospiraceae bacterium]|nr:TPM domain-containing protein [Oscillospiraceae bacterium]
MKNKLLKISVFSVVFALISCVFSAAAFAANYTGQYVYDYAGILDDTQYEELNSEAARISENFGCGVHFVITDDTSVDYYNIQQYSEDMYLESPALGYGDGKDGVMLVLGTYDRCYWLLAYGEKGNFAFTDYAKDIMAENFVDNFSYDDWYGGLKDYISDCEYVLEEARTGRPVDVYYEEEDINIGAEAYALAFVVGLVSAVITCLVLRGQMKTAKIATQASDYINRSGVAITNRHQMFRFSTVSRTKIESSSSGGGSRGGTTVSSRGFSGRGGRF